MMNEPLHQLTAPEEMCRAVESALAALRHERVIERIWSRDHTVWRNDSAEISNRLGWLDVAEAMRPKIPEMNALAAEVRSARYKHVVLLGMGGSSLCPEVLRATFGSRPGYPELIVLDSTVAGWVRRVTQAVDPARALFVVSSKSGGTIEVMSFFKHFWSQVEHRKRARPGEHFVAITDPGTSLNALAAQHGFRRIILNPPDIGGRYSALSYFGLVPAALCGLDLSALLDSAIGMMNTCKVEAAANPAAWLGATMGALAKAGRDKVTFVTSPSIATFGLWAEQLIAESTGKEGRGIVPIALEPSAPAGDYSADRLFAVLRLVGDKNAALDRHVEALKRAGHPVFEIQLARPYDLGAEFFRWELATAIAGHLLDIHPFDQPNVQESKDNTRRVLDRYKGEGALPNTQSLSTALPELLKQARQGDYVALMGYLPESPRIETVLDDLRLAILSRYHLPNTFGYGPRFLHSTGQLHKGGANNGLFVQLTARPGRDVSIPGELFSFGVLTAAQALGDFASLQTHERRAIRIDLGANPVASLRALARSIADGSGAARGSTLRETAGRRNATPNRKTKQRKSVISNQAATRRQRH